MRISRKCLAISAVIIGFSSFAAGAGDLSGTVNGANGEPKFLVKVMVAGLPAYTDRNGYFQLSNLPNGAQSVQITEQARRHTEQVTITTSPTVRNFTVNW